MTQGNAPQPELPEADPSPDSGAKTGLESQEGRLLEFLGGSWPSDPAGAAKAPPETGSPAGLPPGESDPWPPGKAPRRPAGTPAAEGGEQAAPRLPEGVGVDGSTVAAPEEPPSATYGVVAGDWGLLRRYELLEEVSRGSMGIVYKARQRDLKRVVALKILRAGEYASEAQVARFRREAQAVARVAHPAIVQVYEVGEVRGTHYLAMEFVEGKTLAEIIAGGALSPRRALEITATLADALDAAHEANVIHRDIKPSNIMVDRRGRIRIMDFGLAKQVGAETRHTQSGTTIGTPSYMSPEQARGELNQVDRRSDVYSLGAVLYEMVAGKPPFSGQTVLQIVLAVIHQEPTAPRKINPKINRDVQTIILKCLEKEPARRYPSAAELRDDVRRFLAGEAIRARPVSRMAKGLRQLRRHAVSLAALAAVAMLVWVLIKKQQQLEQAAARREEAEQRGKMKSKPAWVWEELESDLAQALQQKPDQGKWGQRIAAVGAGEPPHHLPTTEYFTRKSFNRELQVALDFQLKKAGGPGFRLGFVSHQMSLPLLVCVAEGRLALEGLQDVEAQIARLEEARRRARPPPRLETELLAEQPAHGWSAGGYRLEINWLGVRLEARLLRADRSLVAAFVYKNPHLSNWRFKRTQLVIRDYVPDSPQLHLGRFEVKRRTPPEKADRFDFASRDFLVGDYETARADLQTLAQGSNHYDAARAFLLLGMVQEIAAKPEEALVYYRLGEYRLPGMGRADLELEGDFAMRQLYCQARLRKFEELETHLARLTARGQRLTGPWHDPWCWDLHWVIQHCRTPLRPGGERRLDLALEILKSLHLPSGVTAFVRQAKQLASDFAKEGDIERLTATYEAYPWRDGEVWPFLDALSPLCQKRRFEEAIALLKAAAYRFPEAQDKIAGAARDLCDHFLAAGQYDRLRKVHETVKDGALAGNFQKAIRAAAAAQHYRQALELLSYARRSFDREKFLEVAAELCEALLSANRAPDALMVHHMLPEPSLADALSRTVLQLCETADTDREQALSAITYAKPLLKDTPQKARLNEAAVRLADHCARQEDPAGYYAILRLHEQVPEARLAVCLGRALEKLLAKGEAEKAMELFLSARAQMGAYGRHQRALVAWGMRAFVQLGGEPLARALRRFKNVEQALAQKAPEAAAWRLEAADFLLLLGRLGEAVQGYETLAKQENAPRRLRLTAQLRLALLDELHSDRESAAPRLRQLGESEHEPDLSLAGRYLLGGGGEELIEVFIARAGEGWLTEAEWEFIRGVRMWATARRREAERRFNNAKARCAATLTFPYPMLRVAFGALRPGP